VENQWVGNGSQEMAACVFAEGHQMSPEPLSMKDSIALECVSGETAKSIPDTLLEDRAFASRDPTHTLDTLNDCRHI
jgi:hypothetical protein